mmetsp:Transcript_51878/g.119312  ORF Transcript_51878/g.119312 Transcript_51878/m.119312 type:complete len:164 (-) Transcript_51878:298-789(-)
MSSQLDPPRKRVHNGDCVGPPAKRSVPTVSGLQKELQAERERSRRMQESVEQLRLEMQLMGRLFAASREQIVALGGATLSPEVMVRAPITSTSSRSSRSRADVKALQRIQSELSESKGECKRLNEQVRQLRHKLHLVLNTKQELAAVMNEMHDYLNTAWMSGC